MPGPYRTAWPYWGPTRMAFPLPAPSPDGVALPGAVAEGVGVAFPDYVQVPREGGDQPHLPGVWAPADAIGQRTLEAVGSHSDCGSQQHLFKACER